MSRILLVDDSPHAQRMGERILSEEGYEVVTVSNADSALIRLDDVDPDVVLADTVMPGRTGYEICQYLKMSPRHRHVRVILTAGVLETLDEAAADAGGGGWHAAQAVRGQRADCRRASRWRRPRQPIAHRSRPRGAGEPEAHAHGGRGAVRRGDRCGTGARRGHRGAGRFHGGDGGRDRPARAGRSRSPETRSSARSCARPRTGHDPGPIPARPGGRARRQRPLATRIEPVRRVSPLRLRSNSILGLDIERENPE